MPLAAVVVVVTRNAAKGAEHQQTDRPSHWPLKQTRLGLRSLASQNAKAKDALGQKDAKATTFDLPIWINELQALLGSVVCDAILDENVEAGFERRDEDANECRGRDRKGKRPPRSAFVRQTRMLMQLMR